MVLLVCVSQKMWCIVINLRTTDPYVAPSGSGSMQDSMQDVERLDAPQIQAKSDVDIESIPVDLADEVEGMYRLMDLISESGSHGYGKEPFKSYGHPWLLVSAC